MATYLNRSKHVYVDNNGCNECGAKVTRRYISDNVCVGCHARSKPDLSKPTTEAEAIQREELFYYPKKCNRGAHRIKLMVNGSQRRCYECRPEKHDSTFGRPVDVERIDRLFPDMLLSRKDAALVGYKVYNTGKPCKHGHKSWRFVSSGACIECQKNY